jgi:ABC-type Na+ efflux pump permease subunit
MTDWIPWKIARKELKVISRKRSIIFYNVGLPLIVAVAFSLEVKNLTASGIPSNLSQATGSIIYLFVILATVLPSTIAAYSIVGEKIEKTLEPLLATPTTDGEILLGKGIAAFILPVLSTWIAASIFMAATDYILRSAGLSYYYFPNWNAGVMLLLLAPLASVLSIEIAVIASSRVTDVRGANQIAGLMFIPFVVVFFLETQGIFTFNVGSLMIFALAVLILDAGLFFVSKSTFNREEILTKWK